MPAPSILIGLLGVGCGKPLISNPVVEKAIRGQISKPKGKLTEADLEKVTILDLRSDKLTDVTGLEKLTKLEELYFSDNQLTDVKGLENLTKLESLWIGDNPSLTKSQIAELQKALPKCDIESNPKK